MTDVFGIPIIESDLVPKDKVLVVDGRVLAAPGLIQRLIFLNEIRSIVQRGLKAAFPDLLIPRAPRTSDHASRPAMDLPRRFPFTVTDELPPIYPASWGIRPHRADGHACSANLPAPLGRPCPWCGALPYVLPGTPEGPIERVAWSSDRAQVFAEWEYDDSRDA